MPRKDQRRNKVVNRVTSSIPKAKLASPVRARRGPLNINRLHSSCITDQPQQRVTRSVSSTTDTHFYEIPMFEVKRRSHLPDYGKCPVSSFLSKKTITTTTTTIFTSNAKHCSSDNKKGEEISWADLPPVAEELLSDHSLLHSINLEIARYQQVIDLRTSSDILNLSTSILISPDLLSADLATAAVEQTEMLACNEDFDSMMLECIRCLKPRIALAESDCRICTSCADSADGFISQLPMTPCQVEDFYDVDHTPKPEKLPALPFTHFYDPDTLWWQYNLPDKNNVH